MSYRFHHYTSEVRDKWLREGRGSGEGASYKGWLTVHDVPASRSYKTRLLDRCHSRVCHLLSRIEERAFLYYDASEHTIALYDQYRLDLNETLTIAKELNIPHPRDPDTREWWDITTDLLIIIRRNGKEELLPRSCKPTKELKKWNQLEHAEIERVYWARRNSRLKFVTETDSCIPSTLASNLDILKHVRFLDQDFTLPYPGFLQDVLERMRKARDVASQQQTLAAFCGVLDKNLGVSPGQTLRMALHLIYRRAINANLTAHDIRYQPLSELSFPSKTAWEQDANKKRA